jgi:pectate lyase
MKCSVHVLCVAVCICTLVVSYPARAVDGWASVAGYGIATTTGGGNATPQLVTTLAQLRSLAGDGTPRVIQLSGTFITGDSPVEIKSNKTLVGVDVNATIQGGINVSEGNSNIIVRNLSILGNGQFTVTVNPVDTIAVRGSHHLWFDHLNVSDGPDGNMDLTVGTDYVTVSWCKFWYTDPTRAHRLSNLVGNGSTSTTDTYTNNVTFHHNWYAANVDQRMPRLLFGKGHVYNSYYSSTGNSYCIGTGSFASILIENNYFKNINSPHKFQDTNPSYITAIGNVYDNTTGSKDTGLGYPSSDPSKNPVPFVNLPYSYTLDAAQNVPAIVMAGAGNTAVADTTAPTPNPMTWASVPIATGVDTITMTVTAAIDSSGVEYYFANVADPNHDSGWQDGTVYADAGLTRNTTYTYRVKARDKSAGHNETSWSAEPSATTIRYTCTTPIAADNNTDCKVDFMDYAVLAGTWGAEPGVSLDLVSNGSFDTDISSWAFVNMSGATGTVTATFSGTVGNPAGSALVAASNTVATNNHRFYQVVPVIVGRSYTLSGEWSGNIVGLVTDPTSGSLRNWAEIFVGFEASTTPADWTSTSIMYKKTYGAGLLNTTTGIWSWETFTSSPNGSAPPAGGIFTATAPYMVIAFNLGGRASSGSPYIDVDNIHVVEAGTSACPEMDLNDDCAFDWLDIHVFAADWLACSRNPVGECLR